MQKQIKDLQVQMRRAMATVAAFQGQPADATLSIPHNDSWVFADNVDATHAANFRYIVSKNVTRVVSARLSIHLAPYRTYNTLSVSSTGTESAGHNHGHNHSSAAHTHTMFDVGGAPGASTNTVWFANGNTNPIVLITPNVGNTSPLVTTSTTPGNTGSDSTGESATHTHNVSATGVLGVTEGTTATGVTLTFDGGPDVSGAFGGPFTTDQIELDVRSYLKITQGVFHTIAMTPSGNGRIEAHLRLGVYVSAAQVL